MEFKRRWREKKKIIIETSERTDTALIVFKPSSALIKHQLAMIRPKLADNLCGLPGHVHMRYGSIYYDDIMQKEHLWQERGRRYRMTCKHFR